MKVTLLTTVNSRSAGGLYYSVRNLAIHLLKKDDIEIDILSYNDKYSGEDVAVYEEVPMSIYTTSKLPLLSKLGFSFDLSSALKKQLPDIIHQQGIWMFHSSASLKYKKSNSNVKTVIAPRGMLDPWLAKRSPFVKKIVRFLYENENLRRADCIHALCESEYESIRSFGLKNPVAIIPNGTIIPQWERQFVKKEKKTLLFLGRIHPKKGLSEYITAVSLIKKNNPNILQNWTFKIGGWSQEGYLETLQNQVEEFGLNDCFEFVGSLYGKEKEDVLKNADAFILPSHSEGMPMAILEAWAYGLPVIMTDFCNIPTAFSNDAAIRIDIDAKEMNQQLELFLEMNDEQIYSIGLNGYKFVKENFLWDIIADQTIQLYSWLMGKDGRPNFVRID